MFMQNALDGLVAHLHVKTVKHKLLKYKHKSVMHNLGKYSDRINSLMLVVVKCTTFRFIICDPGP